MMDRKNQTENDILGMKESRFSGEERARMAQERAGVRESSQKKDGQRQNARERSSERASKAKDSRSRESAGQSRNDRVRSSVKQRKKEKKLQNNIIIAMLFVIAVALVGVLCVVVLKINTVEVTGTEKYSSASVLSAAGLSEGDSMVLINTNAMEAKIEMLLPYIEKAEIKRRWPDKVVVSLEDAKATLAVDTGEGYILMNNSCKILDTDAANVGTAALIKGVNVNSPEAGKTVSFEGDISTADFTRLTSAFEENKITGISEYDLTSISSIVVMIDHRIEVRLGTLAGAAEKFAFGKKVIEETVNSDSRHAILIDITNGKTAYVRQKNDNNAVFGEEATAVPEESTSGIEEITSAAEETTAVSVG